MSLFPPSSRGGEGGISKNNIFQAKYLLSNLKVECELFTKILLKMYRYRYLLSYRYCYRYLFGPINCRRMVPATGNIKIFYNILLWIWIRIRIWMKLRCWILIQIRIEVNPDSLPCFIVPGFVFFLQLKGKK
jgi:hypothetical protein